MAGGHDFDLTPSFPQPAQRAGTPGPWGPPDAYPGPPVPEDYDPQFRYRRRPSWLTPLILFVATCVSTLVVQDLAYALTLMTILLAHEMGHYLQSVRYGVPASLPLFIPMPLSPIGTMGAVILQRGFIMDRKALFDIAISGPLAGLVFAIPALFYGMSLSSVVPDPGDPNSLHFGEMLLVKWVARWQFGPIPVGHEVQLHSIAFAGWVGIFITALNLIPISQLDGGHVLYALLRRRAHPVALFLWAVAVVAVLVSGMYGWVLMLFLIWMMGIRHPPTANDNVPLGPGRVWLGWLTLSFFFIGFTPVPFYGG